jgi:hypothetical protein
MRVVLLQALVEGNASRFVLFDALFDGGMLIHHAVSSTMMRCLADRGNAIAAQPALLSSLPAHTYYPPPPRDAHGPYPAAEYLPPPSPCMPRPSSTNMLQPRSFLHARNQSFASSLGGGYTSGESMLAVQQSAGATAVGGAAAHTQQGRARSRGVARRVSMDERLAFGWGDARDPPDATEEAAVFMNDISHSAWRQFTDHIAQEARPSSVSSLRTGQQALDSVIANDVRCCTLHGDSILDVQTCCL